MSTLILRPIRKNNRSEKNICVGRKVIMKYLRKKLLTVLLAIVCVFAMPMDCVHAGQKTALSKKDFTYTYNNETTNFITDCDEKDIYRTHVLNEGSLLMKTSRGIKPGSSMSTVKKQYGKAEKQKVDLNDNTHSRIVYEYLPFYADYYFEYTYKKSGDEYCIRFYADKKDKVRYILYGKNLMAEVRQKTADIHLSFKAPNGKKVTMKTIDGKKVYLIPKGSKMTFTSESDLELHVMFLQYDKNGNCIAKSRTFWDSPDFNKTYSVKSMLEDCYQYDYKNGMWKYKIDKSDPSLGRMYQLDLNKLGQYDYFAIRCSEVVSKINYSWSYRFYPLTNVFYFKIV